MRKRKRGERDERRGMDGVGKGYDQRKGRGKDMRKRGGDKGERKREREEM